jgi:hypothetical protein
MQLIQLTLDQLPTNETGKAKSDLDYQTELTAIWESHVKEDRSGVYVCWVPTEAKERRQYRRKKEKEKREIV